MDKKIDWESDWKDVRFNGSLCIVGIVRGRSAAHFEAYDKQANKKYTIFLTDFLDMLQAGDVNDASITGEFKVMKRGRNFGVRLVNTGDRERDILTWKNHAERPIPEYI